MSKLFKESIHSDIIIHWTGRDFDPNVSIEPEGPPVQWHEYKNGRIEDIPNLREEAFKNAERKIFPRYPIEHPSVRLGRDLEDRYLERLKDILKFGLWMTKDEKPEKIYVNRQCFDLPVLPRICFTELKLSESRRHAFKFGRLGIGIKRLFLTFRGGQPMHYINSRGINLFFPPYVDKEVLKENRYAFFKNMSPEHDFTYDYYSESEWRIIFDPQIEQNYFVNPRGPLEEEFKKYTYRNTTIDDFKEYCSRHKGSKLQYLIPLDGWLAMIIYPSPETKNRAKDYGIHELINKIKLDNAHRISPQYEQEMIPVELDLDLCNHF
jgi:hypothetical protein